MRRFVLTVASLLLCTAAFAEPPFAAAPPPPAMPDSAAAAAPALPPDIPEEDTRIAPPDVRIVPTPQGPARIEEFKTNGRVYMVRVTPAIGPAYYLVDTDGDGRLDSRRVGEFDDVRPTMWRLFSW